MIKSLVIGLCLFFIFSFTGCGGDVNAVPVATPLPPATITADDKLVSLFFDDAFLNQYEVALPILRESGFRATFGVIAGYIGTGHGLWEYMDEKHLKELAEYGMDIASHTWSHPNLTANLTDEQLHQEIVESKLKLEEMGFKINTMVYPYYEWDERVITLVRKAGYTCARAGWSKERAYDLNTPNEMARYHAFSWQITDQDIDTFKLYLEKAGTDKLVSLTYHFIADGGPDETSTPVANFKDQMAYLKEAGYTVVPFSQLFN